MALFYLLALSACLRFAQNNLAFYIFFLNLAVMLKAHIAWEKYILPFVVLVWFFKSINQETHDLLSD
jgi:hypothetical protein